MDPFARVKLTKVSDCENPRHAGNIADGHVVIGTFTGVPVVGQSFVIDHWEGGEPGHQWFTSKVTEIIDAHTFKTLNSIYRWDIIVDETAKGSNEGAFIPYEKDILRSKIHNGQVTGADLEYEGSVTIGKALLKECGMKPYDRVMVVNLATGARIETYVIEGTYREIKLNGAAARQFAKGDRVIIMHFVRIRVEREGQENPSPTIVILGDKNLPKENK